MTPKTTSALALAALLFGFGASAEAQAPTQFTIDQSQSVFTWTADAGGMTVNGVPNNNFALSGTAEADLYGTQPVQSAQLTGSDALVVPDIQGQIPPALPFLPPSLTLLVSNLRLSTTSDLFVVGAGGAFITDLTLTALSGTVDATVLGTAQPQLDLTGATSVPTPANGTLTRAGNVFTLVAPVASTFAFTDPNTMTTVTITLSGMVVATAPAVDVTGISFCNGDGGDQMGCTDCPCGNNGIAGTPGGCVNGSGTRAVLDATGLASTSNDSLRFGLFGGNPNTFAILSSADQRAPANATNPCFGLGSGITSPVFNGLRCVVQGVQRHGTRPTDANGDVGVTTNGWGPPNGPAGGILFQGGFVAGQTRHFQVVYREEADVLCMTGQNTSDAVSVTVVP